MRKKKVCLCEKSKDVESAVKFYLKNSAQLKKEERKLKERLTEIGKELKKKKEEAANEYDVSLTIITRITKNE